MAVGPCRDGIHAAHAETWLSEGSFGFCWCAQGKTYRGLCKYLLNLCVAFAYYSLVFINDASVNAGTTAFSTAVKCGARVRNIRRFAAGKLSGNLKTGSKVKR